MVIFHKSVIINVEHLAIWQNLQDFLIPDLVNVSESLPQGSAYWNFSSASQVYLTNHSRRGVRIEISYMPLLIPKIRGNHSRRGVRIEILVYAY